MSNVDPETSEPKDHTEARPEDCQAVLAATWELLYETARKLGMAALDMPTIESRKSLCDAVLHVKEQADWVWTVAQNLNPERLNPVWIAAMLRLHELKFQYVPRDSEQDLWDMLRQLGGRANRREEWAEKWLDAIGTSKEMFFTGKLSRNGSTIEPPMSRPTFDRWLRGEPIEREAEKLGALVDTLAKILPEEKRSLADFPIEAPQLSIFESLRSDYDSEIHRK